ncbi:hypothetical protein GCM10010123_16680 [Pilimelia anulata]|uniref:Uncharacterized protein n=1 Tax=Pilimelia anulata TaxID=53371 RepID=A0A8J3B9N5_9ACTN|nr:hypothetical protein [Pilimelia anulata]GGJ87772.1 hypothetical protein GCM10010123_16680 [Pilimelia anulata]
MPDLAVWGVLTMLAAGAPAAAPDDPVAALVAALPGVPPAEVRATLRAAAAADGGTVARAARRVLAEIAADRARGAAEQRRVRAAAAPRPYGGSGGEHRLVRARHAGDAYYTPAATAGVDHGHVGLYSAVDQITEIAAGKKVYTIPYHGRWVRSGAALFEVRVARAGRDRAVAWALGRVGRDGYSYNFATNRLTAHVGAKNCSKLVWSAYRATGGPDLDRNGGAGVYPRDVRDAPQSTVYRVIGG